MKKYFLGALFLLITSLVCGCGFHLRGQHVLPPKFCFLKLESNQPYGDFEFRLRSSLSHLGVNVTRTGCAPVTLHILSIALFQDVPTIGGSNQARVYVYYYRVNFEVYEGDHHVLIPPQSVTTSKSLIINPGTALESTEQRTIMIQEMQIETSHMIINFLNAPKLFE